jgi:hypothetical protein
MGKRGRLSDADTTLAIFLESTIGKRQESEFIFLVSFVAITDVSPTVTTRPVILQTKQPRDGCAAVRKYRQGVLFEIEPSVIGPKSTKSALQMGGEYLVTSMPTSRKGIQKSSQVTMYLKTS